MKNLSRATDGHRIIFIDCPRPRGTPGRAGHRGSLGETEFKNSNDVNCRGLCGRAL
jgi:hypothetical protein